MFLVLFLDLKKQAILILRQSTTKYDKNQGFLLVYWMQTFEQIIGWENRRFNYAFLLIWKCCNFLKFFDPEVLIFTHTNSKELRKYNVQQEYYFLF